MKYTTLSAFRKHLDEAIPDHLGRVYLLVAKEDFARSTGVDLLISRLPKGAKEAVQRYEAPQVAIGDVLLSLNSPSFFSPFVAVHVAKADALHKDATERVVRYLQKPLSQSCLILSAESFHRGTRFYKAIEKAGIILDIPEQKPWEKERSLADWIRRKAERAGKTLSATASTRLVQRIGADATSLQQEWEKLLCYVADRPSIMEEDIDAVCVVHPVHTVWQVGEALFAGDGKKALDVSRSLLCDGEPLLGLLRQLRSQWQKHCQIASIVEEGGAAAEITQDFPYLHGAILEKNRQEACRYGKRRLIQGLLFLDETELLCKNGMDNNEALLESAIAKLCL